MATSLPKAVPGQNTEIDSLLQHCEQFEMTAPETAINCYQNTLSLSEKTGYRFGIGQSKLLLGLVHSDIGQYVEGLNYLNDAVEIYKRIDDVSGQAAALVNMGSIYFKLGVADDATEYFLEAINLLKDTEHRRSLFMAYGNLAGNLSMMERDQRALYYNRLALSLACELKDTASMSLLWNSAGVLFNKLGDPDSSKYAYTQAIRIGEKYALPQVLQVSYSNLSQILREEEKTAEALRYAKKSLAQATDLADPYYLHQQQALTAREYHKNGFFDSATALFEEAISGAEALGSFQVLEETYGLYSQFLEATGRPAEALHYFKKARHYRDSISGDGQKQYVSFLETRFRTAQNEETIARQELVLARQNLFLSLSLIGGLALLIILLLLVRNFQHRKKLNLQKIEKLKQENEIDRLRALMEGEEKERARIAQELHDSVGGMIGSVQLYLTGNNPNGNLGKAREIVSATANEIRRISHNLMPEVLLREGLEKAVKRFCKNITSAGQMKVKTAFLSQPFDADSDRQLFVFRAIQELVNNALKHAGATEVFVQISQDRQGLHVAVEDNGHGIRSKNGDEGTGIQNLSSRLEKLGGQIDLHSSVEGVSVNLSIPAKGLRV